MRFPRQYVWALAELFPYMDPEEFESVEAEVTTEPTCCDSHIEVAYEFCFKRRGRSPVPGKSMYEYRTYSGSLEELLQDLVDKAVALEE